MAEIISDEFATHGMTLNPKPNKTEALIMWHGEGVVAARREAMITNGGTVSVWPEHHKHFQLRLAQQDTHLGTTVAASAGMRPEVAKRAALLRQSVVKMRTKILANPDLSVQNRILLFQSHALTRTVFQVGTWPKLRKACKQKNACCNNECLSCDFGSRPLS